MPFVHSASHHICNEAMPNSLCLSAQILRHDGIDSLSRELRFLIVAQIVHSISNAYPLSRLDRPNQSAIRYNQWHGELAGAGLAVVKLPLSRHLDYMGHMHGDLHKAVSQLIKSLGLRHSIADHREAEKTGAKQ